MDICHFLQASGRVSWCAEAGGTRGVRREDEKNNHQNSKQVLARCPPSSHDAKRKNRAQTIRWRRPARRRIATIVLKWAAKIIEIASGVG